LRAGWGIVNSNNGEVRISNKEYRIMKSEKEETETARAAGGLVASGAPSPGR
jgi:hypothetical protein